MSFEFELPDLDLFFAVLLLAMMGLAATLYLWPWSADRRSRRVQRWAADNLVALPPEIADAAGAALAFRSRLVGIAVVLAGLIAGPLLFVARPEDEPPMAPWFVAIAIGILVTLAQSIALARPWFVAGATRAARLRTVTLDDYVPRPLRWSAWLSGAVCVLTVMFVSATTASPAEAGLLAAPSLGVLAALAVAEWTGRRTASRPQPARDAAELYAQDAWRTAAARYGFQGIALWGGIATTFQARNYEAMPVAEGLLRLFGWGLTMLSIVVAFHPYRGMGWTRQRLWPGLASGEAVGVESVTL